MTDNFFGDLLAVLFMLGPGSVLPGSAALVEPDGEGEEGGGER